MENRKGSTRSTHTDMRRYLLLFWLQILLFSPTVSGVRSVTAKLHHPVTLTCDSRCSGLLKWRLFHTIVARCDQTSCRSEEGFNISHDQYLKGNPHLTITAADYISRGLYTCLCDGTDICDVRLLIESDHFTREFTPGDSLILDLPISERVKITFNRSGEDGTQSSVTLCTVEGGKAHCNSEYEKRRRFQSSFILSDLQQTDSGVYTVWDSDNDEVISTHTLRVTGTIRTPPSEKGEQVYSSLVVGFAFGTGLMLGIVLVWFVCPLIIKGWNWVKGKVTKRSERDRSTAVENNDANQTILLNSGSGDKVSDG